MKEVPPTEMVVVVVSGANSFAHDLAGNTATDTGGGMINAVTSLSGGTAALKLSYPGSSDPNLVTKDHSCH